MVSQLRIYTIKPGMMSSWLTLFNEQIRPIHRKLAIPVEAAWVNAEQNEFIWVRSFDSAEVIADREEEYFASPGRRALGDLPKDHIAKMEVRVVERVPLG